MTVALWQEPCATITAMRRASQLASCLLLLIASSCRTSIVEGEPDVDAQAEPSDSKHDVDATVPCHTTVLAPPDMPFAGGLAVPIDVERLTAAVTLRVAERRSIVESRLTFSLGLTRGFPVFDLRQTPISLHLNGEPLETSLLERVEFAGTDTGGVLVLRRELDSCSRHELVVRYEMGLARDGSTLPHWAQGVFWTSAFSDLIPGMLIERWFPANLMHDSFEFEMEVEVEGGDEHTFLANGPIETIGSNHWRVNWREADSSTPLWYLSRSQHILRWPDASGAVDLFYAAGLFGDQQDEWLSIAHEAFRDFTARFGVRADMGVPYLLIVDPFGQPGGGMEYSNGAVVGRPTRDNLRHEILHAWLGRSLLPARQIDAWWDEGAATFFSADESTLLPVPLEPLDPFAPEAEPIASSDPWTRSTPLAAYTTGPRVFATIVGLLGRERVERALRAMVEACPHEHITHNDLREVFASIGERDAIEALFERWVIPQGDSRVHGTCRGE